MSSSATQKKQHAVKMQLVLYNKGEVVLDATRLQKTGVLRLVQREPRGKWDHGYLKVIYNSRQDFYNHAYFRDEDGLKRLLGDFLDPYLLKTFCA